MTRLQTLYWKSQAIRDSLFLLENQITRITRNGKTPKSTLLRHGNLLEELRNVCGEMALLEA